MKILIINDSYQQTGGVTSYINLLTKILRSKNHEVYFLVLSDMADGENKYEKIVNYKFSGKLRWFISENLVDFNLYRRIRKYILRINPDIIHFQNIYKATKTILLAARGFPKIQTIHDYRVICPLAKMVIEKSNYAACSGKNKLKCYKNNCLKLQTNLFDFFIFDNNFWQKRSINKFICPSRLLMEKCQKYGYKNLVHLPNPIEIQQQKPETRESNNILFVGRLIKEKGVKYLIDGFQLILFKRNNLRLVIVGDGKEKKYLEKYCHDLNIKEFVNFFGHIEPDQVGEYYKNSLAVVVPSILMEQFGLVALEAMKYGKPIIAFDIGGLSELIKDGENGFLVKRFDIKNLAEKIIFLVDNKNIAEKMGENGLAMAKKYDVESYLDKVMVIYQSAINGGC